MNTPINALLVLNGDLPIVDFSQYDFIICADGAYDKIKDLATVNMIVGDMDSIHSIPQNSIDNVMTSTIMSQNIKCIKLNCEKDHTDGQIALQELLKLKPKNIDIIGASGGRIDHILFNLSLCSKCDNITIIDKTFVCKCLQKGTNILNAKIGSTISLVPFFGKVHINNTKGLKYPVINGQLDFTGICGISNVATDIQQSIEITKGMLLIIINT